MQDSKFSCLVFVRVEKQRYGDANFSEGEMILIGQFLLLDHRKQIKSSFIFHRSRPAIMIFRARLRIYDIKVNFK